MEIKYNPIGIIRSPFKSREGMPVQPAGAAGIRGKVVLNEELSQGLPDIGGFSHLYLIYHFHCSSGYDLKVIPFPDKTMHGIFATRAPRRPNPIGISVVKLLSVTGNVPEIENMDVLNGTPLPDIKPFVPAFDAYKKGKCGWMKDKFHTVQDLKSDKRF